MKSSTTNIEDLVSSYVDAKRDRLVGLISKLVRIPSENTPPLGAEGDCQKFVAQTLAESGWKTDHYFLADVPGLNTHPLYWPGREYNNRPNVAVTRQGSGGGRSLILSGHVDTVPKGTLSWTRDPFGGSIEGDRIYGRGSNDMKAGVATNMFVAEAVAELGLDLHGDLTIETVIDEEFGGVNGTLAGRLKGYRADAAIISEPSFLRVCAAQRGGRTAHVTLSANASGGVLTTGSFPSGISAQLHAFLGALQQFSARRRSHVSVHPLYQNHADPIPVSVTKIYTGPWGTGEPTSIPSQCKLEVYWQTMPGERLEDVDREFFEMINGLQTAYPELFPSLPQVIFPIRWLPGSAIGRDEPVVQEMARCAKSVLGNSVPITGIEGPCDLYVFHEFGIPAILWGGIGGNTHEADEYVEISSVVSAAKTLLLFVCRWCGVQ